MTVDKMTRQNDCGRNVHAPNDYRLNGCRQHGCR